MALTINTRADLDAIVGTLDHETWMRLLAGSIYSLRRNDAEQRWDVVEDTSLIERFEFSRADFADVVAPTPPEFVPAAPAVPQSITPRQARRALIDAGLLATVEGAIASLPEPERTYAKTDWQYATSIERNSPLVAQLGAALGLTNAQIDELFIAGAAVL